MANTTISPDSPDDGDQFLSRLKLIVPGYKLLRTLSHGGQGIVYKAIQEKTGKTVALKVLREGPWADETARQRLEREAKVLASLNHPNIVTVLDSGQTPDGHEFLVMNFIPGMSLDEFFKEHKSPADPPRMLRVFLKICQAINAAHLAGITHRDLSPSNILIDEQDEPHILDFGLARTAFDRFMNVGPQQISVTGQFLGKVAYASPEQARGESVDIRTDVYALGVILYQILTGGSFPYQVVGSIAEVLNNIINTKPTPPSKLLEARDVEKLQDRRKFRRRHPPAVNAVIEAIVLKALEKDPNQRYQSAGELGRDVENYLNGLPTLARPVETSQTRFRRPVQYIAAAIGLCILAGAIGYGLRNWKANNQRPALVAQSQAPAPPPATEPADNNQQTLSSPQKTTAENDPPVITQAASPAPLPPNPKPGDVWTNSIGTKLAYIPPGTFVMGSPSNEPGRKENETQHKVTLTKGFYMGVYDVTVSQFGKFVRESGYQTEPEKNGYTRYWGGNRWVDGNGTSWQNPGFKQRDDFPVVWVDWRDATAFCGWLSKTEGKVYRLPSEAEWEFACRAGTTSVFNTGNGISALTDAGWYSDNSAASLHPVGTKKPNALGLYDMEGNVYQFCNDICARIPDYPNTDAINPTGAMDGWERIIRGGAWNTPPARCRSAARGAMAGGLEMPSLGFRIVMDIPGIEANPAAIAAPGLVQNSPPAASQGIPSDVAAFAGNHYKFFAQAISWPNAEKQCEQMGGQLACPATPEIQKFLQNLKGPDMTAWVGGQAGELQDWDWLDGSAIDSNRVDDKSAPPDADCLFLSRGGNLAPRKSDGKAPGTRVPMIQGFICQWDNAPQLAPAAQVVSKLALSQREIAQRVLQLGGTPTLSMDGRERPWSAPALPDKPFTVPEIKLAFRHVSDADIAFLKNDGSLRSLNLRDTPITDAAMSDVISTLSGLNELGIQGTKISSRGLTAIKSLGNLKILAIGRNRISDISALAGMNQLSKLSLWGLPVPDESLKAISGLTNLTWLCIRDTKITDGGLQYISGLVNLTELDITNNNLTDEGVKYLAGMSKLTTIMVGKTAISDAAVHKVLPNCQIQR